MAVSMSACTGGGGVAIAASAAEVNFSAHTAAEVSKYSI